jgi:hypothetical protein
MTATPTLALRSARRGFASGPGNNGNTGSDNEPELTFDSAVSITEQTVKSLDNDNQMYAKALADIKVWGWLR